MKFKLQKLSREQLWAWIWMNVMFGVLLFRLTREAIPLDSPDHWVPNAFLVFCWLVMVGVFRLYIQDKDPMNFKSLLGFKRKKQSD